MLSLVGWYLCGIVLMFLLVLVFLCVCCRHEGFFPNDTLPFCLWRDQGTWLFMNVMGELMIFYSVKKFLFFFVWLFLLKGEL